MRPTAHAGTAAAREGQGYDKGCDGGLHVGRPQAGGWRHCLRAVYGYAYPVLPAEKALGNRRPAG